MCNWKGGLCEEASEKIAALLGEDDVWRSPIYQFDNRKNTLKLVVLKQKILDLFKYHDTVMLDGTSIVEKNTYILHPIIFQEHFLSTRKAILP